MIRIGLLRHGHTAWNRAGRIQGRTDIPLDEQARLELAALSLPASWAGAEIVSSPLGRAVETARIVTKREPKQVEALTEMDWGTWEGQEGKTLKADPQSGYRDLEHWGWRYKPPGGECLADVRERVLAWAEGVRSDCIAVCHIGIMRVFLAHSHGWDILGPAPFQIKRNRLFVLENHEGHWRVGPVIRLEERSTCV